MRKKWVEPDSQSGELIVSRINGKKHPVIMRIKIVRSSSVVIGID